MPLSPGTRLGAYEIVAPLGAGGMGEVYRARDSRLDRDVAVKVLPAEVASHPDRLARFEREAKTVAALSHPNIVVLHSIEEAAGVRFLTMELIEGQSLDRLVTPGGLPVARVLEMGIAMSDALVAAHERGVVHRDLKPANVMVTREGRVKVLDFGLAKLEPADVPMGATQAATMAAPVSMPGQVVGTAPYMAPEQIRGEAVDARTDLFALGTLLYELATGRRPFQGATWADVSSAILRDSPDSIADVRPDLPAELERVIVRCLEKNPRERAQTALDVCNELRRAKQALETGVLPRQAPAGSVSIAVMPFVNRSHGEEDEYFSDGLADELLNMLAKIRGLRVAARSSSFHFKGKDTTIADIGRTLNVATVLEGSVRKAGNRVRISVQLVKVSDGYPVWSESYDRTLEDIFAVQDDIARSVVKELRAALLGEDTDSKASGEVKAEVAATVKGRGHDPEAHRLLLQGRYLSERFTPEDIRRGLDCLRRAVARDPENAMAWMELGRGYTREANLLIVPGAEGYRRAKEAADRALAIEPDLVEALSLRAWILFYHDWNWQAASAACARAMELAPDNVSVLRVAGGLARAQGRLKDGLRFYRRCLELEPLNAVNYFNVASVLHRSGRLDEAETEYRRALELSPGMGFVRGLLALVVLAQGRVADAMDQAGLIAAESHGVHALAMIHHTAGRSKESDEALRELKAHHAEVMSLGIAQVHAVRGDADEAFHWLDRALELRSGWLSDVEGDPWLRSLTADPRWEERMRIMGKRA